MTGIFIVERNSDSLCHHGIKGQQWGKRKYQNQDGSLTPAGKQRYYGSGEGQKHAVSLKATGHKAMAKIYRLNEKTYSKSNKTLASMNRKAKEDSLAKAKKAQDAADAKANERNTPEAVAARRKKAVIVGAAAVASGLAIYGAHKYSKKIRTAAAEKMLEEGASVVNKVFREENNLNWGNVTSRGRIELTNQHARNTANNYTRRAAQVGSSYRQAKNYLKTGSHSITNGPRIKDYKTADKRLGRLHLDGLNSYGLTTAYNPSGTSKEIIKKYMR